MDTENGSRIKYGWLPFHTHLLYQMSLQVISCFCYSNIDQKRVPSFQVLPIEPIEGSQKWSRTLGARVFWGKATASCESSRWKAAFHIEKSHTMFGLWWSMSFQQKTWHVMTSCVEGCKVTFRSVQDPQGLKCCRNSNPSTMTNVYYMFEVILIKKIYSWRSTVEQTWDFRALRWGHGSCSMGVCRCEHGFTGEACDVVSWSNHLESPSKSGRSFWCQVGIESHGLHTCLGQPL